MEKITTDIYSFETLRQGGYVYVDKTDLLWRLAADKEGRQFFIARPRRFGKSLMLSTLKCIFEGKALRAGVLRSYWVKTAMATLVMERIAAAGKTPDDFEGCTKAAIRQIRENGYAGAYKGDRRPVTLVGINFRLSKRNIDEPLFAKL